MYHFAMIALVALSILAPVLGAQAPVLPAGGVTDAAARARSVAPGSRIRLAGSAFASSSESAEAPSAEGLAGASVEVDDGGEKRLAPVFSVSPTEIEALLPFEIASARVAVSVRNREGASSPDWVDIAPAAPQLLAKPNGGRLEAVALHAADGRPVDASAPAEPGETVLLFSVGLGAVDPPLTTGTPGGNGAEESPLNYATQTVEVSIGDQPAELIFAGLMPGAYGIYQINAKVPDDAGSGFLPVRVLVAGQISQLTAVLAVQAAAKPSEFFVSPGGSREGDGSRQRPWDLATALAPAAAVKPGDTIWLLGGDYGSGRESGSRFESKVKGAPGRPVRVRQFPGERAVIHPGLLIQGEYAWYEGFEVKNDNVLDRYKDQGTTAVDMFAPYSKLINLVIHDNTLGIGLWTPAVGTEVYGCIIYNNGFLGPERGHGHGIYTQNREGTKLIHDNIIFNQFQLGIQAYGSGAAYVEGFDVRGNILFNNGILAGETARVDNILFAVGRPMDRITVEDNYTYHTPSAGNGYSRVGWGFGPGPNGKATVRNNYWIGGQFAMEISFWRDLTFTGNTLYSPSALVYFNLASDQSSKGYTLDNNTYFGRDLFAVRPGPTLGFEAWKTASGGDRTSKWSPARPKGEWIFVRPNRYEEGRGHVVIYNWDLKGLLDVDISAIVKPGNSFELRDAQNIFGPPVLSGVYRGGPVTIPMGTRDLQLPQGQVPNAPKHTLPEFGTFVVITKAE